MCIQQSAESQLHFQGLGSRKIVGAFDGGTITSDAGGLLLCEVDLQGEILDRFAAGFVDRRETGYAEHPVRQLLAQRVYGLCLGYEDLNDHEQLRHDPLFAALCGQSDVLGERRRRVSDAGKTLAGKSTLQRLERSPPVGEGISRYHRIFHDADAIKRFFHGFYNCYCYLPLYIFCEDNHVDYLFGLARNKRLQRAAGEAMQRARLRFADTGRPAKVYKELRYKTRKTWSRKRRVVAKAKYIGGKENPRLVVTSLSTKRWATRKLYEKLYCARGEMENRIKEQQLYLFADRTSAATMRANQLRLWFSSVDYLLMHEVRRQALGGSELARAQCHSIRTKLLKIGARVTVSTRRIVLHLASGYPYKDLFAAALSRIQGAIP